MARIVKYYGLDIALEKGVEIVGHSLRINFIYRGKRCYETLPMVINQKNAREAATIRAGIVLEIRQDKFNYGRWFPNSRNAATGGKADIYPTITVAEMLAIVGGKYDESVAPASKATYQPKHRYIIDYFGGGTETRSISVDDCQDFKRHLVSSGLKHKTINNVLVPLRAILKRAFNAGVLERSVHDRFNNYTGKLVKPAASSINPLSKSDIDAFSSCDYRAQDRDAFLFCMFTGISQAEMFGLAWDDVDTRGDVWKVTIQRNYVKGVWKCTKEEGRDRTLEISSKAKAVLKRARILTQLLPAIDVDVLQRDNQTLTAESIRPVFRNSHSGNVWNDASNERVFKSICRRVGIEERGPNQCRHTFASQLLTKGAPLEFIARMMGHSDVEMVKRHYGQFITADNAGNDAALLNQYQ